MNDHEIIIKAIVDAFFNRNPDLVIAVAKDSVAFGYLQPETMMMINERLAKELMNV